MCQSTVILHKEVVNVYQFVLENFVSICLYGAIMNGSREATPYGRTQSAVNMPIILFKFHFIPITVASTKMILNLLRCRDYIFKTLLLLILLI